MTLVTFNPSRKVNKPYHSPIYMNYQQINEVNSHKHLRLYLSRDCTWHEHIEHIKAKVWQRIHAMRRLKFILDRKSLQTIYFAFIRPLHEYADVVWGNCSMYESNEKNQNKAARIVTGATKLVSINALLIETRWETFSSRRTKHNLILIYKMKNILCAPYLDSLVPNNVGDVSRYNLINVQHSQTVHALFQFVFPSVIREWNALPQATIELSVMDCFTNQLNADIILPQKLYFLGNHLAQIYHAGLRTGCSTLRLHLY